MRQAAALVPLAPDDFEAVATVARVIWHAHYDSIIGAPQVDYMLGQRFSASNLGRYVAASDRWWDVLKLDREIVGYCSCALNSPPGEMKLEQLYLLERCRGLGLGGRMLEHVETSARAHGCTRVMLQVNKHNADSLAIYRHRGYTLREAAAFDIGGGFVMDDYVMELKLASPASRAAEGRRE